MMNIQKQLDKILEDSKSQFISKNGERDYDENIDILEKKGYLKPNTLGQYLITNEGRIFIGGGGFSGEIKSKEISKYLQYGFWLANIISLLVAICSLNSATKKAHSPEINLVIYNDSKIDSTIKIIQIEKFDSIVYLLKKEMHQEFKKMINSKKCNWPWNC